MTEEEYERAVVREWLRARNFMANLRREAGQRYTVRGEMVIWDAMVFLREDEQPSPVARDTATLLPSERTERGEPA